MASSLDKLSSNLKIDQFVNQKKYYRGNQLSFLLREVVYPYDYVDCMKKKLGDYQHAHSVWQEFNIESMRDCHKL